MECYSERVDPSLLRKLSVLLQQAMLASLACCAIASWAVSPSASPQDSQNPRPTLIFSQFSRNQPLRVVVYGDMRFADPSITVGTNPRIRRWLAGRVAKEKPEVMLLTGDTPFIGARAGDWLDFQRETAPWRARHILVLPTTGNHEVRGGESAGIANYLRNFPQIRGHRYYSALLGPLEVISLDCTLGSEPGSDQAAWFAAQLSHLPSQVRFLFLLYHIPWVADEQSQWIAGLPSKSALDLRGILDAHMAILHARVVVFIGHIHNYERFVRNGAEYVVTGGGGAEPYPLLLRGSGDLYRDMAFPVYHFLTIDVDDGKLHAVMWKIQDPDATKLRVVAKDQFFLSASARIDKTGTDAPFQRKH